MYYTIYKTTNKVNGKFYIGSHKTKNLDDNYMGSGKLLLNAINKYGIENFEKEILFVFDNPNEMFAKEAEIVNEDFLSEENTYNLNVGGFGGWNYVNEYYWTDILRAEHNRKYTPFVNFTKEQRAKYGRLGASKKNQLLESGDIVPHTAWNKGLSISDEHRTNISLANKGICVGERNSQYGKRFRWMNNKIKNKKVPLDLVEQHLNEDWIYGKLQRKKNST